MLVLSGTEIKIKNMTVSFRQDFASVDESGESSITAQAETGDKAKILGIAGVIAYKNQAMLEKLISLTEAKNGDDRAIYRITNRTASAAKISQVKFSGSLSVSEDASLKQWSVSFELTEHDSVAEKKEKRKEPKEAKQQKVAGVPTMAQPSPLMPLPPNTENQSYVQSLFAGVNNRLI